MCRLSRNLGASNSWNPKGLSRPVMGLKMAPSSKLNGILLRIFYQFTSHTLLFSIRLQHKPYFFQELFFMAWDSFAQFHRSCWHGRTKISTSWKTFCGVCLSKPKTFDEFEHKIWYTFDNLEQRSWDDFVAVLLGVLRRNVESVVFRWQKCVQNAGTYV
jgi:hypothetical protein